jgi:hypothetical protein
VLYRGALWKLRLPPWLLRLREQRLANAEDQTGRARIGCAKNEERDQIILQSLRRGSARLSICEELDRRVIPTLPVLRKKNTHRWKDGWADPGTRNAIQQRFSKFENVDHLSSLLSFPHSFQIAR